MTLEWRDNAVILYCFALCFDSCGLMLPLWSSASPTVTRFFLRIYPSDLGSGIHFVSTRLCCVVTGDCVALRVRTAARWTGLGSTKHWCQQMEATRPPVCSVISQTNPNSSNWNPLAPVCVLYDPKAFWGILWWTINIYLVVSSCLGCGMDHL